MILKTNPHIRQFNLIEKRLPPAGEMYDWQTQFTLTSLMNLIRTHQNCKKLANTIHIYSSKIRLKDPADSWLYSCKVAYRISSKHYLFDEYPPYLWTVLANKVHKYSTQIRFKKPADSWLYLWTLFDEYLPVFWTLFVLAVHK